MKSCILAIAMTIIFVNDNQLEKHPIEHLLGCWNKIERLSSRLRGRFLASQVTVGMSPEQVDHILGKGWSEGVIDEVVDLRCFFSNRLGLTVFYLVNKRKNPIKVEVIDVIFLPFFE